MPAMEASVFLDICKCHKAVREDHATTVPLIGPSKHSSHVWFADLFLNGKIVFAQRLQKYVFFSTVCHGMQQPECDAQCNLHNQWDSIYSYPRGLHRHHGMHCLHVSCLWILDTSVFGKQGLRLVLLYFSSALGAEA